MSEPFIAEIRMFGGNFAPRNWAFCDGQILPISQNTALFSIVGTFYGGDGESTLGLPNLQGRAPMHAGNRPGLTPRSLGANGGTEAVTLNLSQMPSHNHSLSAATSKASSNTPTNDSTLAESAGGLGYDDSGAIGTQLAGSSVGNAGNSQPLPHNNMQPFLTINFIIALTGTYPSEA